MVRENKFLKSYKAKQLREKSEMLRCVNKKRRK
jgi:hypothetical protein